MKSITCRSLVTAFALAVAVSVAAEAATSATMPATAAGSRASIKVLAMQWFAALQSGRVDRTKLDATYNAHLSGADIVAMSRYLKPYGAPRNVEIVQTRSIGAQTFYEYRLILERGDALSMLMGFDHDGRITAVTFASMGQS